MNLAMQFDPATKVLFGALALMVVAFLVVFLLKQIKVPDGKRASDYYLRKSLLTPAERSFLGVLEALRHDDYQLCVKVRLADIVGVRSGLERGERQAALNRVQAKHVDFLFIRATDGQPVLAVELDDASHEREDRRERDAFVDQLFSEVGLPVAHVRAQARYTVEEVRGVVERHLKQKPDASGGADSGGGTAAKPPAAVSAALPEESRQKRHGIHRS